MDNMPTTTTNTTPQASIAGEGDDDDDKNFCIQIKTFHLDCVGVVVGPESQEVDENFLCGKLTSLSTPIFGPSTLKPCSKHHCALLDLKLMYSRETGQELLGEPGKTKL